MKRTGITAIALAALLASGSAFAQQTYAPGQRMQSEGSVTGSPGASGYAPGQEMRTHKAKKHYSHASTSGRTTGSARMHSKSGVSGSTKTHTRAPDVDTGTGGSMNTR